MYSIGIKRPLWFGFKKYLVRGHRMELEVTVSNSDGSTVTKQIKPRLVLRLHDNTSVMIPKIDEKLWIVYSDFYSKDANKWQESEQKSFREQVPAV